MEIRANGKLLLTGEYLVTKGAKALAMPLKYGQSLFVSPNENPRTLIWDSYEIDEIWFRAEIDIFDFEVKSTSDQVLSDRLIEILQVIKDLKGSEFFILANKHLTTRSNFNFFLGLGSSSTLLSLLAQYFDIDIFDLSDNTFGGSGYDVACATSKGPIIYQNTDHGREVEEVNYNPFYKDNILFVYLGNKMNSRSSLSSFNSLNRCKEEDVQAFNEITERWLKAEFIEEIEDLIFESEDRLSYLLNTKTVKETSFDDYPYSVKSLGAWGGDMVLATYRDRNEAVKYFKSKGHPVMYTFQDMINSHKVLS
ncbi:MAG: GYDIA family GHMP kinase [Crocinitomicaceae bacterium]